MVTNSNGIKPSFEDLSNPEARERETIRISKLLLGRAIRSAKNEMEYLIDKHETFTTEDKQIFIRLSNYLTLCELEFNQLSK